MSKTIPIQIGPNQTNIPVNKTTLNLIFHRKNPSGIAALYLFYLKTSQKQETNTPICTNKYVANALKWSIKRVSSTKRSLIELGLIVRTETPGTVLVKCMED